MLRLLIIAFFLLLLPIIGLAQVERALFTVNNDINFKAGPDEYARIAINFDENFRLQLPKSGEIIQLPMGGEYISFRVQNVREYMPGVISFSALDVDQQDRHLTFSYDGEHITGMMHLIPEFQIWQFSTDKNIGTHVLAHIRPEMQDILVCEFDGIDAPHDHYHNQALQTAKQLLGDETVSKIMNPSGGSDVFSAVDGEVTIDLMLVYTPAAANWASTGSGAPGSIALSIAQMMNLSQSALDNSNVGVELRLVHSYQVSYDELGRDSTKSVVHLDRLRSREASGDDANAGYLLDVHTNRDAYGADIVAMLLQIQDVGGIAYRPSGYGLNSNLGFSVNRIQQLHNSFTLIHEIGHNMGKSHGRNQDSNAATVHGGVHPYSTGWKFEASGQTHHTVMQYRESTASGFVDYPAFSSPLLSVGGVPAGSTNPADRADNARSIRDVKGVMANYRPTMITPPSLDVTENQITISIPRNQTGSVPISLSNTGTGPLRWSIEVGRGATSPAKALFESNELPVISNQSNVVVYETGFESSDGFSAGTHRIENEWRSMSSAAVFQVSTSGPSSGSQHLRIGNQPDFDAGNYMFMQTPLFDRGQVGAYTVEFDIKVNDSGGSRFYLDLFDSQNGFKSGGILFFDGFHWSYRRTQEGTFNYTRFGSWSSSSTQYHKFAITVDSESGNLYYFKNGSLLFTTEMVLGSRFDYLRIEQSFQNASDVLDLDNFKITRHYDGYSWLSFQDTGGTINSGASGGTNLLINAVGMAQGVYSGNIVVQSNEGPNGTTTVPIQLTVTAPVSIDRDDIPSRIALSQNYPNPFNPTTAIRFQLPSESGVLLQVFDVTGREVARLLEETRGAGDHTINFDASALSSGLYMYRLQASGQSITRKLILVK
jgi:hypothetical protein